MENSLSKTFMKKLAALDDAKGRRRTGLFMAEGTKCVSDTASAFDLRQLLATEEWLDAHPTIAAKATDVMVCSRAMLGQATHLTAIPPVIGLFALPEATTALPDASAQAVVALDRIQDPGNLGTIMRTCDWMGIRTIVASPDTADMFNPKVVQASMGAIAQVKVVYTDLPAYLDGLGADVPVFGTFLGGEDVFSVDFPEAGVYILGNEGSGISEAVGAKVSHRLTIPSSPGACAESLNVAAAAAMILALRAKSLKA